MKPKNKEITEVKSETDSKSRAIEVEKTTASGGKTSTIEITVVESFAEIQRPIKGSYLIKNPSSGQKKVIEIGEIKVVSDGGTKVIEGVEITHVSGGGTTVFEVGEVTVVSGGGSKVYSVTEVESLSDIKKPIKGGLLVKKPSSGQTKVIDVIKKK